MKKLYKRIDLYALLVSGITGQMASDLLQFMLSLYVLEITGSGTIFASLISVIILPRLILSPIAGVVGDRVDRKKFLILVHLFNAALISGVGLFILSRGTLSLTLVYAFVIVLEMAELFYHSCSVAVAPSLFAKDELASINSITSMTMTLSGIVSPILAGILYGRISFSLLFFITAALYVLAALAKLLLKLPAHEKPSGPLTIENTLEEMKEGFRFLGENPFFKKLIFTATAVNMFLGPFFNVVWTYTVRERMALSPELFGLSQSIMVTGMFLGGLFSMVIVKKLSLGRLFGNTLIAFGALVTLAAIGYTVLYHWRAQTMLTFWMLTAVLFLLSLVSVNLNVALGTISQRVIPLNKMSRVSSVSGMLAMMAIPVGSMVYGWMVDHLSLWVTYFVPAVATSLIALIFINYRHTIDRDIEELEHGNLQQTDLQPEQ